MAVSRDRTGLGRVALWFYVAAGLLIVIGLVATIAYLGPFPPRVVVMTTGAPGGAYEQFGRRYKAIFARAGVELRLMPSAGAVENLAHLNDPHSGVSVGFVQGGLTSEKASPNLLSLGTVGYEPIWFFYRGVTPGRRLEGLRGRKMSIGPEGSGSRAVALELLALNGIGPETVELLPLTAAEAGERLRRGEISAALMVASWDTPIVRQLLADPHVNVAFTRADAYVALYPFLTKLVLPAGVGDMITNRPPKDVNLLAPKTSLIVRNDVHPAIQNLLLSAAVEIHSGPGIFQKSGQFPAPEQVDLPLSDDALQFYKSGRPFLQRYLPFWLAVLGARLLVLLIPVVAIAYPLLRVVPAIFGWSMRRRVFRLYGELKSIELESELEPGTVTAELIGRLDRLEARANRMRVPLTFAHLIYALRLHIDLVQARLQQRSDSALRGEPSPCLNPSQEGGMK